MSDIEVGSPVAEEGVSAETRERSKAKEKKQKKEKETKSKAQVQREERDAEKTRAEEEAAAKRLADKKAAKEKKAKEAASGSPKETRPKAQQDRDDREAKNKTEAEEKRAAKREAAKEKKAREDSEPPSDTRSKAQKDRDERLNLQDDFKSAASSAASSVFDFANSKTKSQNSAAAKEGLAIFDGLCNDEPEEVADWFLTQVKKVGKSDKGVENLPLYKFASAINSATDEQRQTLAKAAISGYGAMEAEQRAQVLTLVVQSAGAAQKASKGDNKHIANLRDVVKAARFDKMPEKEKESLMMATQTEAMQFATPHHIAEALTHMSEDERKQLSGALVQTKLIPADQAGLIDEVVQPDGILDEVHAASTSASLARDFVWVAAALPVVEWLCAKRWLKKLDCSGDLVTWLHVDACLSLAMVLFVAIASRLLGPAYDVLASDPAGALRRWQSSGAKGEDFDARLQNTVRLDATSYKIGSSAAAFSACLALLGGAYAAWGVWLLINVVTDGCIELSVIFIAGVISLRSAFIVLVLYVAFRVYDLLQRHKFIGSGSGSAMETSPSSYGSMEDAADANSKV